MSLIKKINYYIDDDGYYRRIPWDSWYQDGSFFGLSPVGIKNDDTISFDSNGVVSCDTDFLDIAEEGDVNKRDSEIKGLLLQTDERSFLLNYDNVIYSYESEKSQTYELDYDKPSLKE